MLEGNEPVEGRKMRDAASHASICALLLTVPLTLFGCEKAATSEPLPPSPPPPTQPTDATTSPNNSESTANVEKASDDAWSYASFSNKAGSVVDGSKRLGNVAIAKSKETSEAAIAKSRELCKTALESSETVIVTVGHKAGEYVNTGGVYVDKGIRMIAIDPSDGISIEEKGKKMALQMIPVVSSVKRYADARAIYENADQIEDEVGKATAKHDAKRQCLAACVDLGFDITVIGAAGKVEQLANLGDMAVTGVKITGPIGKLLGVDIANVDLLNMALDRALGVAAIDAAMDQMLCFDLTNIVDLSANAEN